MPLVKVRYKHGALTDETLEAFGPALCYSVAQHFNCPGGGELTEEDVEVAFEEASSFDVSAFDVSIDLEAMHFPVRHKGDEATGQPNFDTRTKAVGEDIRNMLPADVSFGLWAKLNNASWYSEPAESSEALQPDQAEKDPDAWDPMTGKRPSDPINWGYAGPR